MNPYYDVGQCGIGYHGDGERSVVVALRLGADMELCYRWHLGSTIISEVTRINLHAGDVYVMSEKAVGSDWKRRVIPTLRHAAGCKKYTS